MNVTIGGNVATQPEYKVVGTGKRVLSFRIAENLRRQVAGEWREDTSFYTVEAWGDLAEHAALSIDQGDRIVVTGVLRQHDWTTDAGERRSRYQVTASDIGASLRFTAIQLPARDTSRAAADPSPSSS